MTKTILIGLMWMVPGSALAGRYETALAGKPLMAGLGFEGVLTVYDETPRMYTNLGQPKERPEHSLSYVFEGGAFALRVRAVYSGGRFLVEAIRLSGDRARKVVTGKGLGLGDSRERAIALYGPPTERAGNWLRYPAQGIGMTLNHSGQVSAIEVFRPVAVSGAPQVPGTAPKPDRVPPPAVPPAPPAPPSLSEALAALGAHVPVPDGWSEPGARHAGAVILVAPDGGASLTVTRCDGCRPRLQAAFLEVSKALAENRMPIRKRTPRPDELARLGAEEARFGVWLGPTRRRWLVGLRRGDSVLLVSIELALDRPVGQATLSGIAAILSGARWASPHSDTAAPAP